MAEQEKKVSWFKRHKVLTVIGALIILGLIAGGSSSSKNTSSNKSSGSTNSQSAKTYRFTDRADKQKGDVELLPKETGTVGGVKLTVSDATYEASAGDFDKASDGKTYAIVTVALENASDRTKPYNEYDFRVQTASGQVLDPTFVSTGSPLNSGDLVAGGKVSGVVPFEVPIEDGHEYLVWKPSSFSSDRAIIQLK